MKPKCWCGQAGWGTEVEARRRLGKVQDLGLTDDPPTDVRKCSRGVWHFEIEPGLGLAVTSKKRQRELEERRAMVRELWPDLEPACIVADCPRLADDVHEPLSRGRGGAITDPDNAVPICRTHHDEVTFGEPEWAYEQGLLIHSWDAESVPEVAERRRALQLEAS